MDAVSFILGIKEGTLWWLVVCCIFLLIIAMLLAWMERFDKADAMRR